MKRLQTSIFYIIIFTITLSYAQEYRKLTLDNELKVILVSDDRYNKSAASMNILAGSLSDPEDFQGLAHFLEHMLFLGTEKYPDVEDYSTYLKSNGGYANAYTAEDHTNYMFEIYHDAFEGALDRFSQFFISPLFTPEYTEREMNAVNSEYKKNLEQDYWRMRQVKRNLYNPDHPSNHFEIGTLETLSKVDRDVLINFHQRYYSANQMSLAILSNLDLDTLEKWAKTYFLDIKNRDVVKIEYPKNYLEEKDALRLLKVEPIKDVKRLVLEFPAPAFYSTYLSKPDHLLGYLIGHEGEGSLLSLLKSKGLATGLGGWGNSDTFDYGNLNIWIELTTDGFSQYEDVLTACFSYIEMLKEAGYQSFIFKESSILAELEEKYADKGEGAGVAVEMSNNLAFYPMKDAERVKFMYEKEDPELYLELLSYIRPDNMLATLSGQGIETNKIEKWYSAEYSYTEINDEYYQSLFDPIKFNDLKVPNSNPFMPKSVDILPIRNTSEQSTLVYDVRGMSIYHSRDLEFERPKANLNFKIRFPESILSLENSVLMDLYISSVNESLNEVSYPARLAGLDYSVSKDEEGISIRAGGYNSSLESLVEEIIIAIKSVTIDETRFSVIMDATVRQLENSSLDAAYQIARRELAKINKKIVYSPEEKLSIIASFTLDDVKKFPKTIFNGVYVEALAHGNITKNDAVNISMKLRNALGYKSIKQNQVYSQERLKLEPGEKIVKVVKSKVNNSAYVAMYDIGGNTPHERVMAMLINTFIGQPYYMEMRTNQQLGYIVAGGAYARENYSGMYFIIQSDGYPADVVESRSLEFLTGIPTKLDELTEDEFNTYKGAVIEQINEKSTSIAEEAKRRFYIAYDYDNDYERNRNSLLALESISIQNMKEVLVRVLDDSTYQNVTVLLYAEQHEAEDIMESTFEDRQSWRSNRIFE